MLRSPLSKTCFASALCLAVGALTLTACGRNPGAQPRSYPIPGIEKLEERMANAQAKCVKINPTEIRRRAVVQGKEMFAADRAGSFRLEKYEFSKVAGRVEGIVPNLKIQVTDFDDLVSRAPRLSIEATCMDLKGVAQELKLSPVVEIESETGQIQQTQPFVLSIPPTGSMSATSLEPARVEQPIPVSRMPSEAAMLLGADNVEGLRTISFRVKESEDGSMEVNAEFADSEFSRIVIRVRAVYRWDAAA